MEMAPSQLLALHRLMALGRPEGFLNKLLGKNLNGGIDDDFIYSASNGNKCIPEGLQFVE